MRISGINGLSVMEINNEIRNGGKFVVYQYCASVVVASVKDNTRIQFIRHDESSFKKGLKYSLATFLVGWWGIPYGPFYTISTLITNFKGGIDVTDQVMASMDEVAKIYKLTS